MDNILLSALSGTHHISRSHLSPTLPHPTPLLPLPHAIHISHLVLIYNTRTQWKQPNLPSQYRTPLSMRYRCLTPSFLTLWILLMAKSSCLLLMVTFPSPFLSVSIQLSTSSLTNTCLHKALLFSLVYVNKMVSSLSQWSHSWYFSPPFPFPFPFPWICFI